MSVEPIRRVLGPRTGIDGTAPLHALAPVTREQPDQDGEGTPKRRPRPPRKPADQGPHRGDDGRLHVDLHA